MKKGKLIYLILAIILFLVLLIPFFQNAIYNYTVMFFKMTTFTSMYMPFMLLCMIEGALITLYIKSLFTDIMRHSPTKFDLK